MEREKTVKFKSLEFAKRIVKLYKYLCDEKREFVLSKHLLRSGTSIGANITEAECGISRKDFLAKMYIAFKECAETGYWLELLLSSDYITEKEYQSIKTDCDELMKMLTAITKTTHSSLNKLAVSSEKLVVEEKNYSLLTSNCSLNETNEGGTTE